MNIKQIQEHNRKKIICAVHNADDYGEPLRMDLNHNHTTKIKGKLFNYLSGEEFIGKPLTLDRVLRSLPDTKITLKKGELYIRYRQFIEENGFIRDCFDYFIWDLTKEILEEQTEETQIAVAKLLGYKFE